MAQLIRKTVLLSETTIDKLKAILDFIKEDRGAKNDSDAMIYAIHETYNNLPINHENIGQNTQNTQI